MGGKNRGICHGCRKLGHYLLDCPKKKPCPVCHKGIEKCMEVEKRIENLGKLFFCCTNDCTHFKWLEAHEYAQYQGESSGGTEIDELSGLLTHVAKITEAKDVEISFNSARENEIMIPRNEMEALCEICFTLCNSEVCVT